MTPARCLAEAAEIAKDMPEIAWPADLPPASTVAAVLARMCADALAQVSGGYVRMRHTPARPEKPEYVPVDAVPKEPRL